LHPHTELAESVRLLVEAGNDINATARLNDIEHTALMVAVMHTCCSAVLQAFLQNGADASVAAAPDGKTALQLAAAAGRVHSCRLLLERASSLIHDKNDGGAALGYAAGPGHLDVVKLLL
jgi:ankyrin repeat protein